MDHIKSIRSSYVRYKENTQKLLRWLVETASTLSPDEDETASPYRPKNKKGKGKSKKTKLPKANERIVTIREIIEFSKLIAARQEQMGFENLVPEAVYAVFDFVIQTRKIVAERYMEYNTSPEVAAKNRSHGVFIAALEEAFAILGGTAWRQKKEKGAETTNQAQNPLEYGNILHMSNRFAELEIGDEDLEAEGDDKEQQRGASADEGNVNQGMEDRTGKPQRKPKKSKLPLSAYKLSEDFSEEEEVWFATWCLFVDTNSLRQYLKTVWNQKRKGSIDLVTASTVSSVAVGFVKQLEANLELLFPHCRDYPSLLQALFIDEQIRHIKNILGLLDFCMYFTGHSMSLFRSRMFESTPNIKNTTLKELEDIATLIGLDTRWIEGDDIQAEKIREEAAFLEQYLFDLMTSTNHADQSKEPQAPRLGEWCFHADFEYFFHRGELKAALAFGIQVFLDIRAVNLHQSSPKGKDTYRYALSYVSSVKSSMLREIEDLRASTQFADMKRDYELFVKYMDNWIEFAEFQADEALRMKKYQEPKSYFLSKNPWHLGLVQSEVTVQAFEISGYHSTYYLCSMLHLYNFLRVGPIVCGIDNIQPIPVLEFLCEVFKQHVFQGARPQDNFASRFVVSSRKEIVGFASDAGRAKNRMGYSAKRLERLSLPSNMSLLHALVFDAYMLNGEAWDRIQDFYVQLLSSQSTDGGEKGQQKVNALLYALSPPEILDMACGALWIDLNGELPVARVHMLKIRELSEAVWHAVHQRINWRFPTSFDLIESILRIQSPAIRDEIRKKIINDTKDVFRDIFREAILDDFFVTIPIAKVKGWKKWEESNITEIEDEDEAESGQGEKGKGKMT